MDYQCLCDECYGQVYGSRKEIVRKEVYHLVEYEREVSNQSVSHCQNYNCDACRAMRAKIYDYDRGYY